MDTGSAILASACLFLAGITILVLDKNRNRSRKYRGDYDEYEEVPKKKFRLEFSKIIIAIMLLTYFYGIRIGSDVVKEHPEHLGTFLAFVTAVVGPINLLYLWKAKAENCIKLSHETGNTDPVSVETLGNITTQT